MDWLVERISGACLLLVAGVGHMVPEERPCLVHKAIAAFASPDDGLDEELGAASTP